MKLKLFVSICVILLLMFSGSIYETFRGPIEAEIAINQLKDSKTIYGLSRKVVVDNLILNSFRGICVLFFVVLWLNPFIKMVKKGFPNEKGNTL